MLGNRNVPNVQQHELLRAKKILGKEYFVVVPCHKFQYFWELSDMENG